MVAIATAVLVTFIGGLYFITHHKKDESDALSGQKVTGNGLPPKPEERWRYIKELENRQPGIRTPTEPSSGGEITNAAQLTSEQRQLLEQMQADMRQQPTQLNEVPWNEQTAAQRQQTLQRQRQAQLQLQQQQQYATAPRTVVEQSGQQQLRSAQTATTHTTTTTTSHSAVAASPYDELMQNRNTTQQHNVVREKTAATQTPATSAPRETEAAKPAEKKDDRNWMVQCGSFRGSEQAETVRAQLAFEGFSSKITTNNGWNRVVIGPLKGKDNAESTISRLRIAGHTNCIRLATGG